MLTKATSHVLLLITALLTAALTGCTAGAPGSNVGIFGVPIPVSPFFQKQKEDEFWEHERYARVPILPPISADAPPEALDEPSDDEVMRTLEKTRPVEGGIPLLHEVQRNNVSITKELISDFIDPVRVMPLVGPVQQHHAKYKCTVYFTETIRVGWPLPHTLVDEDAVEVIYIDHNHLHHAGNVDMGPLGAPVGQ